MVLAQSVLLLAFACQTGTTENTDESTDGMSSWMPSECANETPFSNPECHDALVAACHEHRSEPSCIAQETLVFGQDFEVLCTWAKVVTFSEPATCTVASVQGRCEVAVIPGAVTCGDPCDGGEPYIYDALQVEGNETFAVPCGPSGVALELLSPSASCGGDIPPPPEICTCTKVACEAE